MMGLLTLMSLGTSHSVRPAGNSFSCTITASSTFIVLSLHALSTLRSKMSPPSATSSSSSSRPRSSSASMISRFSENPSRSTPSLAATPLSSLTPIASKSARFTPASFRFFCSGPSLLLLSAPRRLPLRSIDATRAACSCALPRGALRGLSGALFPLPPRERSPDRSFMPMKAAPRHLCTAPASLASEPAARQASLVLPRDQRHTASLLSTTDVT
mmetsp:Transcript_7505/g.18764  ORF Transcript_7505/g.18764 Transcript_7505/m.18764 type:complete len:215 (-) Transcript_7505:1013-1657(-)